jgi:hypothetical protein
VIVAQLVRAPDCGSGGRGFEPRLSPSDEVRLAGVAANDSAAFVKRYRIISIPLFCCKALPVLCCRRLLEEPYAAGLGLVELIQLCLLHISGLLGFECSKMIEMYTYLPGGPLKMGKSLVEGWMCEEEKCMMMLCYGKGFVSFGVREGTGASQWLVFSRLIWTISGWGESL